MADPDSAPAGDLLPRSLHFARRAAGLGWSRYIFQPVSTRVAKASLLSCNAEVGDGFVARGWLRLHVDGKLRIGRRVRINSGPSNFVGGDRRMALWVGVRGALTIEDGCALSNSTIVCTSEVRILEDTFVGGGCEIYDTDFHPLDASERVAGSPNIATGAITIGPRAFVGGFSIVLKDVTIGEGSIIGAGSLVTRSVPAFEVWGGVPARFLRRIDRAEKP